MRARTFVFCALAGTGIDAAAADLVVYDNASENGFNQACSFNASPDFAETAVVHSAPAAISFAPASFGAVSWCTPASLSTTSYSAITFWVNGGASGGQDLELVLGLNGQPMPVASASLATLLGQPIPANAWVEVNASFDSGPMAYSGNFDQISIQDNSGNDPAAPQPTVYFDDVSLTGRVSVNDQIFKNGFETVTGTAPILIEQNVTACTGNLIAERYTWQDAGGWTRSATFSHNDTNQNGAHEGELCDYTYHTDAATVRDVQELTAGGAGGFGYIVSHLVYQSAAYNAAIAHDGDDSPLGHGFKGTFTRLLSGRHHAILRFQLDYPRWGVPASNVPTKYDVPVTIDWLIATGRDHSLWSVSYDLSAAPDRAIEADSRAPYGDMAFDGAGSAAGYGNDVSGVAWGDHYKFTTTQVPMTLNSGWTWNQRNTIPYVYLWTQAPAPDAEMGIVQTEDIDKQDAASEFTSGFWTHTSADLTGCPGSYTMPCVDYQWAYQANADDTDTTPKGDKHLTWGTGYGFLGDSAYTGNDPNTTHSGWSQQSYSTFVTFGLHSVATTSRQVTEVENAMSSTFSAAQGMVLAGGPSGYDRVYATWNVDVGASANAADVTLAAGGSGLRNPIFVLHHHSAAPPAAVSLDGASLVADVDYFATVDTSAPADTRLWITVNRTWTGSHELVVQ